MVQANSAADSHQRCEVDFDPTAFGVSRDAPIEFQRTLDNASCGFLLSTLRMCPQTPNRVTQLSRRGVPLLLNLAKCQPRGTCAVSERHHLHSALPSYHNSMKTFRYS